MCVARGHLEEVGPGGITLVVKQKLRESLCKENGQGEAPLLWRIDRDDIASNYVRARSNLIGVQSQPPRLCGCAASQIRATMKMPVRSRHRSLPKSL